jgi:hypothetical protein
MADRAKKVTEMPAVTAVGSADLFIVVANAAGNAVTSQVTGGNLLTSLTRQVAAPTTTGSTGTVGQFAFDTNFIYICVATNSWRRAAVSNW